MVNAILRPSPFAMDAQLAEEIRSCFSIVPGASIQYCPSLANLGAHEFQCSSSVGSDFIFNHAIPLFLYPVASDDLVHKEVKTLLLKK